MRAFISNFHNDRFTTSRKHFREHSRLMFFRKFVQTVRVEARDFYLMIVQRFASYRVTLLCVKLKFYYKTHDLKQNWFHTESSFSNQMFLSLNFVWYSKRWLSAESQFSWSSEQNHSKITSHEFAYSKLKDESLKRFICNPCLHFSWLFSLSYFSISDKDELVQHFCKSLWQYYLNIIRLISHKMRWLLYIQKQNI